MIFTKHLILTRKGEVLPLHARVLLKGSYTLPKNLQIKL